MLLVVDGHPGFDTWVLCTFVDLGNAKLDSGISSGTGAPEELGRADSPAVSRSTAELDLGSLILFCERAREGGRSPVAVERHWRSVDLLLIESRSQ